MIIFQGPKKKIVFIHIPKNSGKYIRQCIKKKFKILHSFWDVGLIDRAHIPFRMRKTFIKNAKDYRYITFVRNPYDRFISAFYFKFPKATKDKFEEFILNILPTYNFNRHYNPKIIHFYPQYLFLTNEKDEDWNIHKKIDIFKLEDINTHKLIQFDDFKLKKYVHSEHFTSASLKVINKIYHKDFVLFNYPKLQIISQNIE